jgi:hypothetical protein
MADSLGNEIAKWKNNAQWQSEFSAEVAPKVAAYQANMTGAMNPLDPLTARYRQKRNKGTLLAGAFDPNSNLMTGMGGMGKTLLGQ